MAGLAACAGPAPPNPAGGGDGGVDADAGSAGGLSVSGMVTDYFTGNGLDTTLITTDGLDPPASTTDLPDSSYSIAVATASKLYLIATRASYHDTRNVTTVITDTPVSQQLAVLSESDVARQYTTVGATQNASDGFVVVQLEEDDGTPVTGIGSAAIKLLDEAGSAAAVGEPYFFGAVGDLDPAVTTATAEGGSGSRAAFLNVPAGQYTVAVTFTPAGGSAETDHTPLVVSAGGATLVQSGGTGSATSAPPPTNPTFAANIWPALQTAAQGGLGCANCHTVTGPAGASSLPYDGDPTTTLGLIMAASGVIDTAAPAMSLLVTNPLYTPTPHDHPNATFLDTNDPNYQLFLAWITQGTQP